MGKKNHFTAASLISCLCVIFQTKISDKIELGYHTKFLIIYPTLCDLQL